MAQRSTHKGDRVQIMTRPPREVYDVIRTRATALGIPMGQYVADVLAHHVGMPELMRELGQEVLPLAM
ncbi:toxin-antitoxin system [Mycolicibacterium insubricum]|uniref:Toxin-antitoxin system n=1 Tax=Mycolicibacterium insubricum TaxID=444597 RepID=A0A1X0CRU6_9MYCO|nr:toxin-antitoxin system [Mycolicibacterium insubricum]MCV7080130.1 toxin-antitoxin system [Mycolicibacterium insubricum]ORA62808.1 toxin-antitoxin system [Mycolicibacterium insubricum]